MAKDGVPPDIAEGLRRMNFEEKMAEARERRARVLADRARASAAVMPSAPKAEPTPALEAEPTPPPEEPHVLVLDDAFQVRQSDTPDVVADLAHQPDLFETKTPPLFQTIRTWIASDTDDDAHKVAGSAAIAIAAFLTALTFGLDPAATSPEPGRLDLAGPVQPAPPVAGAEPGTPTIVMSALSTTQATRAPRQTALAQSKSPALRLAPGQTRAFAGVGPDMRVIQASAPGSLTASLPPLTAGLSAEGLSAGEGLVVRVIVPGDVPRTETSRVIDEIGRTKAAELDAVAQVDFRISATHVRYYHPTDRTHAEAFARGIGGEARDFTQTRELDRSGYLEVYLKGGTSAPAQAVAATAEATRTIDQILEDVLGAN